MANSNLVSWSPAFSVGVTLVDDQHKELLRITNDLSSHCVGNEESERAFFGKVIHDSVDYIQVHFSTEEKLMLGTTYDGYAEHKREHDAFVLTVLEKVRHFRENQKFDLAVFTCFLKDWILNHIAVSDKRFFEYFRKVAVLKADGSISLIRNDVLQGG